MRDAAQLKKFAAAHDSLNLYDSDDFHYNSKYAYSLACFTINRLSTLKKQVSAIHSHHLTNHY